MITKNQSERAKIQGSSKESDIIEEKWLVTM